MQKFINNVGLKPLYFWGNEADAISAFALGLAVFDTLRARDITKMCDMTKELTEYVMIRQKILQQLPEWIECNLEHPISIEDIAQKSGYSRRNIQLLFRNFMHVPLGEYIRKRRLCRAAILVRLSAKSMLDIALSLHFDSQQSFSREFKKLFGCSPREYRHRDYWDLANIFPSFLIRQQQKTECRLVNFPETPIFGNSFKYDIEVSNKLPDEEVKLRRHHLVRCMKNF